MVSHNHHPPRCPRCEGRLFLESESQGRRLLYFWECSLGCSRQWGLNGKPLCYEPGERGVKVVRELALSEVGGLVPIR